MIVLLLFGEHRGWAATSRSLGDPAAAQYHYQQALTLYTNLGTPDADQIRAHLTTIDDDEPVPQP